MAERLEVASESGPACASFHDGVVTVATTPSWSTLLDGDGTATTTPDLLADLLAPSAVRRRGAREELYHRYVTDEPVSGLPEVVKALVQLTFDDRTVETSANIRMLVDLVIGRPRRVLA